MTATLTDTTSVEFAQNSWDRAEGGLFMFEQAMKDIILYETWKPLGYPTFAAAYKDKLGHLTLAAEMRPAIIVQMITEGLSDMDIALSVKGVGPTVVEVVRRQYDNGVPTDGITTTVRQHERHRPSAPSVIRIDVGETFYIEYNRIAREHNSTVEQIAREAVAAKFAEMA